MTPVDDRILNDVEVLLWTRTEEELLHRMQKHIHFGLKKEFSTCDDEFLIAYDLGPKAWAH